MIVDQNLQKLYRLRRILLTNPGNFIEGVLSNFPVSTQKNNSYDPKAWKNKNIAVEFSSPNIAKPFHVGHLRSTFIGRFVANILQSNGAKVTRMNYLGDWGTQFGILAAGFEKFGNQTLLNDQKIMHLYDVYVKANQESEKNPEFAAKSLALFAAMESETTEPLEFWKKCCDISIAEFTNLYKRLNVEFDVWQSESMFADQGKKLVEEFFNKNIFVRIENGLIGAKVEPLPNSKDEFRFIPMAKSDMSTLYLSRDVAAAIERVDKMNFDHIYYVVVTGQYQHFINLKAVLKHIGREDVASKITHIAYGLMQEMSTRKGKTIFVNEMLAKGEAIARNVLETTSTTKTSKEEFDKITPELAINGFLINDMSQKRMKSYEFDWKKTLSTKGDNGYLLQLCHARLSSIEQKCRDIVPKMESLENFSMAPIVEPEGVRLLNHMTENLSETVLNCTKDFEPVYLVNYLFQLSHFSNSAHKKLHVLDSSEDVRNSRLLLFSTSRLLLARCMNILGVNALSKL